MSTRTAAVLPESTPQESRRIKYSTFISPQGYQSRLAADPPQGLCLLVMAAPSPAGGAMLGGLEQASNFADDLLEAKGLSQHGIGLRNRCPCVPRIPRQHQDRQ